MKLSIITICRNEVKKIARTIESVINQNFRDFEYIIIDGASTDGTMNIIDTYKAKISNIISEPDSGIYNAMNKGLQISKGDYVLFLNGGDLLRNTEILNAVFSTPRSADILYGDIEKTDGNRRYLCSVADYITSPYFLYDHTLYHQAAFFNKNIFARIGKFDESFQISGDLEYFKRAFVLHKKTTSEYLPFAISIFDNAGISSNPKYKLIKRQEDKRAKKKTYGIFRYYIYYIPKSIENIMFKIQRKIRTKSK